MNTVHQSLSELSKETNVQTDKDHSFTTERLVKIVLIARVSSNKYGDHSFTTERLIQIVLIARVSSNKYGVGDILEG